MAQTVRARRLVHTPLVFAMMLVAFMGLTVHAAHAVSVNIPDPNLESAVRAELSKPFGLITDADMRSLIWGLSAYDMGIRDLTGLEYATNLKYLNLWDNQITSVEPLRNLNIDELYIWGNRITDITPLAGLTLVDLDVRDNYLDLTPGSPTMVTLATLEQHCNIYYEPQKVRHVTVYRFRNLRNGFYLWTADENEKNTILRTLQGTWLLEGPAYQMDAEIESRHRSGGS